MRKAILIAASILLTFLVVIAAMWQTNKLYIRLPNAKVGLNGTEPAESRVYSGKFDLIIVPYRKKTGFPIYSVEKSGRAVGMLASEVPSYFSKPIETALFAICLDCEVYTGGGIDDSNYKITMVTPDKIEFRVYQDLVTVDF